jgi:phage-related protein
VIWKLRLSSELKNWVQGLSKEGQAEAIIAFDRLRAQGNTLRMPHSRPLSGGLFELRFSCENKATRVTYIYDVEKQIITLTHFVKQKNNEQKEVIRARRAQKLYRLKQEGE